MPHFSSIACLYHYGTKLCSTSTRLVFINFIPSTCQAAHTSIQYWNSQENEALGIVRSLTWWNEIDNFQLKVQKNICIANILVQYEKMFSCMFLIIRLVCLRTKTLSRYMHNNAYCLFQSKT